EKGRRFASPSATRARAFASSTSRTTKPRSSAGVRSLAAGAGRRPRPSFLSRSFRSGAQDPSDLLSSMGRLGLTLITGPANAGKVALLLRRYLDSLDREPILIVPNRSDVDRAERDLLELRPALMGGTIGTFDDVFERIAYAGAEIRPVATDEQRSLVVRRAVAGVRAGMNGLGRSARFGGFADALAASVGELESGLVDPADLDGALATLYSAYRT